MTVPQPIADSGMLIDNPVWSIPDQPVLDHRGHPPDIKMLPCSIQQIPDEKGLSVEP